MAKARKSAESKTSSEPSKKATADAPKKSAAKSAGKKHSAGQSSAPLIDTSLAASNAARLLVAGLKGRANSNSSAAPAQESAMFKQLKAGINKTASASTSMSNLLDKTHGAANDLTKSHQAFNKQVGQKQTTGTDVTRSGVPRRTAG